MLVSCMPSPSNRLIQSNCEAPAQPPALTGEEFTPVNARKERPAKNAGLSVGGIFAREGNGG